MLAMSRFTRLHRPTSAHRSARRSADADARAGQPPSRPAARLLLLVLLLASPAASQPGAQPEEPFGTQPPVSTTNSTGDSDAGRSQPIPEEAYGALGWRHIGPWQGGRVTAVAGVPRAPHRFYMGATGGGVWRTDNAGQSWRNLSDGYFDTTTIGALAVAPSDPNVVYAGTGESPIRGVTTSHGDGVYKSTDGGETWTHLGLEGTRQIAKIVVDPRDADRAWLAAQGNPWGDSAERGVYYTEDGGLTWEPVLQVDLRTGATDLAIDPKNPRVLYASMWQHRRRPWYIESGGPGSGLYKSVDAGETWTKLDGTGPDGTGPGKGLPETMGKVGVAVSADSKRVYALVEAEHGGLYRSDDSGASWSRVNDSRVIQARSWYYMHITADPQDPDTVWVLNVPLLKSIDGGKSFEAVSTPHGDHHDLWISPENPRLMVLGTDGGATVSLDGGETFSTLQNQPTAQIYRVATDDRFPYWVYGGQQDWSTHAIPSRTPGGRIGHGSSHGVGGGESAHIAFDAENPRYVYATSINGTLTEYDAETGIAVPVQPYPEYVFGRDAREQKYRANWNAPVLVSQHDSEVIYYGAQLLLRSEDRGRSWREISPDLTRDDEAKQGTTGGPITNEQAGAEVYGTIFAIAESPHERDTLWVGSDDGLVHLTRDGGVGWRDVTPPGLGETQINSLEASPHRTGGAFLAATGYKLNDFTPRIYRTDDYGGSWRRLVDGLPETTFVRAVREDPGRENLLYAATETGVFVSFTGGFPGDGTAWQSLQLDLPEVPVTDLAVRQRDLVAATQGRGFWILDDLTPLHQLSEEIASRDLHLFEPRQTPRIDDGVGPSWPHTSENAPSGVLFHFLLSEDLLSGDLLAGEDEESEKSAAGGEDGAAPEIQLEIRDPTGGLVRRFSSEESENDRCRWRNAEARNRSATELLRVEVGMQRWEWDLRRQPLRCIDDHRLFRGFDGPRILPGRYEARLHFIAGEQRKTHSQTFVVLSDPRLEHSQRAFEELDTILQRAVALFDRATWSVDALRAVRQQVRDRLERLSLEKLDLERLDLDRPGSRAGAEVKSRGEELIEKIDRLEEQIVQPRHETYDDDINWPNMFDVQIGFLISEIDDAGPPVTAGAKQRLEDLEARWRELEAEREAILGDGVAAFERALEDADADGLIVPPE